MHGSNAGPLQLTPEESGRPSTYILESEETENHLERATAATPYKMRQTELNEQRRQRELRFILVRAALKEEGERWDWVF